MNRLRTHLLEHFDATAVADLDAVVEFELSESTERFKVEISAGSCLSSQKEPTWTIYLSDEETALNLLQMKADPIELFMQKKLASSGYIVTTFRVLRSFMKAAA